MPVIFKGGTSGNREDALPPVPSSGFAQPILRTENNATNPNVHFQAEKFRPNMPQTATPDFMPTGADIPMGSSDVQEQGLPGGKIEG